MNFLSKRVFVNIIKVRDIPVMSNADCNAVFGIVGDGVICIDTAGGRGSCNVSVRMISMSQI